MSQQPPNHGPGPRTGGTLVSEGAPGTAPQQPYASAGVPGVAVSLPGSGPNPYAQQPPVQQPPVQQPPQVQAQQHQPQGHGQGMPSAPPAARGPHDDQLDTSGKRTMYEFTGEHSEEQRSGGRHQTFFGDAAELSMADAGRPERDTNLRGGSAGWIIGVVVVLLAGGIFGALTLFSPGAESATDAEAETPGVSAADQAAPAEPTPAVAAATGTGGEAPAAADGAAADDATDDAAAKAQAEAAAAKAKAEEEAKAKAEAEAKAKAEAEAAEEKKKASTPTKKKSSTTKKKNAPAPSKPSSDSKKPISITPSGGVREPKKFGGLPEP